MEKKSLSPVNTEAQNLAATPPAKEAAPARHASKKAKPSLPKKSALHRKIPVIAIPAAGMHPPLDSNDTDEEAAPEPPKRKTVKAKLPKFGAVKTGNDASTAKPGDSTSGDMDASDAE